MGQSRLNCSQLKGRPAEEEALKASIRSWPGKVTCSTREMKIVVLILASQSVVEERSS